MLELWQPPTAGNNGRGIDVDRAGRVYVAGGPAAEVRVFDRRGDLLAELPTGATGSFLNDVWVGPDGAAYVTDSSLPVIWRVSERRGQWRIERWLDVSGTITYTPALTDFDLGGIVSTADGRFLLTTQGTTGQLWRIDLRTRRIAEVDLGGVRLTNADGIVLRGRTLWVVQNFSAPDQHAEARAPTTRARASSTCSRRRRTARSRPPSASRGQPARRRLQVRLPARRGGGRGSDRRHRRLLVRAE